MYTDLIIWMCVILAITIFIKYKNPVHPLFVFNAVWAVILILESFHLYGLLVADARIYFYIFLGVVAFNCGYILWTLFRKNHRLKFIINSKVTLSICNYELRYGVIYILLAVCILYYIRYAAISLQLYLSGNSLGIIREMIQDNNSIYYTIVQSPIFNAISILIIIPSAIAIEAIAAIDFWIGKKDKILFWATIFLILIKSFGDGGRTPLVNFALYMIMGYVLTGYKLKNKKTIRKRRKIIIIFMILGGILLALFSISRTGATLYKNLYLYFSMEPYMFGSWAQNVDDSKIYGYGSASLNGVSFAFLYIIKNIFSLDFPVHWEEVYNLIRETDSNWQIITGTSTRANAFVTCFWFFYLDGRIPGIIMGMFLYGLYMAHSFVEAIKYRNSRTLSLFALALQGLLFTFIRFSFSNIYYCIAYVFIMLLAYKRVRLENG